MQTLGERIRELREQLDISLRELATKVKVTAPFLSDVELGKRYPSDDVLKILATVLKTTVGDLRKHDARLPVNELRRMVSRDPAMGFALRKVVDQNVNADELSAFLQNRVRGNKQR